MKYNFKNLISAVTALSLTASVFTAFPSVVSADDTDKPLFFSECEDCELTDDVQVTDNIYGAIKEGYSGKGFAWIQNSGKITFEVDAPETGMYQISSRLWQELSKEGRLQYLNINGKRVGSYNVTYSEGWQDFSFGIHRLEKGKNEIQIESGYGFAYFDTVTVDVAKLTSLDVKPELSDKKATASTQSLMNYLCDTYGKHIISGQQEIYGGGNEGNSELEFDWIYDLSGKYPAIRGFDFMNYNPLYGWDDNTTERAIEWVNEKGGIATGCWHINVPKNFADYTLGDAVDWKECTYKPTETDFDTAKAVVDGTKENEYLLAAIDDLAEQLLRLQEADVPIILRPFHEAEGNGGENGEGSWFWWSKAGAKVYKELWKILYTKLTDDYGLHNIIWEYNSYTYSTSPAWYPGDEYVDIVAYDKYNTVYNRYDGLSGVPNEDAISSTFYDLVNLTEGRKMVAMAENDTVPNIENLTIEKAGWLYFCPWYGEHLLSESFNYKDTLKDIYQSDYTITLDELPKNLKTYEYQGGDVTEPTETTTTEETEPTETTVSTDGTTETTTETGTETSDTTETTVTTQETDDSTTTTKADGEFPLGDVNHDGNVNIVDLLAVARYIAGVTDEISAEGDMNGDGKCNVADMLAIAKIIAGITE